MAIFTEDDKTKLNRLDEIVRGNGDVGMRSHVTNNSQDLKVIKSDIRRLLWIMVGAFLMQLFSIAMNSGALS